MIIEHPDLGPRDSSEFVYKGDAELLFRPERTENADQEIFHDYLYLRNNPAGKHRELWYHEYGDRSWLVMFSFMFVSFWPAYIATASAFTKISPIS